MSFAKYMWHQYGIQLSKLSKDKGGFSSSFDECFTIFNEVMAKVCLKAAKSRLSNLDLNGTFRIFNKIKKWNSTSIDNRAVVDLTTYVWTNNAFQQSSIDEKLFYTIQMLPSHLIRSNHILVNGYKFRTCKSYTRYNLWCNILFSRL